MHPHIARCLFAITFGLPCFAGNGAGYVFEIPKSPDQGTTFAYGIADDGTILGKSTPLGGMSMGTVWRPGNVERLGLFAGTQGWAYAKNASGVVAANTNGSPDGERAFLWRGGLRFELSVNGIVRTLAIDISDHGEVAGSSFANGHYRAAVWDTAWVGSLVPFPPHEQSQAQAINEAGVVVGSMRDLDGCSRGFRFDGTTITYLPPLPGDCSSFLADINDAGLAVGTSRAQAGFPGGERPLLWDGVTVTRIPSLNGASAFGGAINNAGHVVGRAGSMPYLFVEGELFALTELAAPQGWIYDFAYDINDAGQIVGSGRLAGQPRGYVLTPSPANLNRDPWVDVRDAELFARFFAEADPRADLNADSRVDARDQDWFQRAWDLAQ